MSALQSGTSSRSMWGPQGTSGHRDFLCVPGPGTPCFLLPPTGPQILCIHFAEPPGFLFPSKNVTLERWHVNIYFTLYFKGIFSTEGLRPSDTRPWL